MINKENYEQFFIDHLDGSLSPEGEAALLLFLEDHPELRNELEGLEDVSLKDNAPALISLDSLKRPEAEGLPTNRDLMLVQFLEGDLAPEMHSEVARKIEQDPSWNRAWVLVQLTKLEAHNGVYSGPPLQFLEGLSVEEEQLLAACDQRPSRSDAPEVLALRRMRVVPDTDVIYPHKSKLKRTPVTTLFYRWTSVAAAAAVLLFVGTQLFRTAPTAAVKGDSLAARVPLDRWLVYPDSEPYPGEADFQMTEAGIVVQQPEEQLHKSVPPEQDSFAQVQDRKKNDRRLNPLNQRRATQLHVSQAVAQLEWPAHPPRSAGSNQPNVSPTDESAQYLTASAYLTDRLKAKLWGNDVYPEQAYAWALAEKTSERLTGKKVLQHEPPAKKGGKARWKLRLGSLEIAR